VVARLPLCATTIPPPATLGLNPRWGFSPPPVTEVRVRPLTRRPWSPGRAASSNTWLTRPHLPGHEHAAAVGDGHAGRPLAAILECVEPVENEVGDRFPRRLDPVDPHTSRGWLTPKLILPKRGVWERHADANRFCAADTNSGPFLR
jgi:hypothetical protein